MSVLEIKNLSKKFGTQIVIDNMSLSIDENTIFGFVGENGAGKTTTMRMIVGLLKPDNGEIFVCNEKVNYGETKTNRFVGYLADVPAFYGFMTATEYLKLCGEITDMEKEKIGTRIGELLGLVGLDKAVKKRIKGYSRGMKQRLGLAAALLNEPKLLICDEPTSALDPVGRKEMLDILKSVKSKTTIIFSTHILSDVERICDQVAIIKDGKLHSKGSLQQIKEKHSTNGIKVKFKNQEDYRHFIKDYTLSKGENLNSLEGNSLLIYSKKLEETQEKLLKFLYENNIAPTLLELQEPTLESLFMEVVK